MVIYVPEHYQSDEYMSQALRNNKAKLVKLLDEEIISFRYSTKGEIYCSDRTKDEIVREFIEKL